MKAAFYSTRVNFIVKEFSMNKTQRALFLQRKHIDIDREVLREAKHLYPDTLYLTELKRKKLQVKDEFLATTGRSALF